MRTFISGFILIGALCACSKADTASPVPTPPASPVQPAAVVGMDAAATPEAPADAEETAPPAPNLLSVANGTMLSERFDGALVTAPVLMIDGSIQNWVGDGKPQSFVFELPQTATVRTLAFDNDTSGMGGLSSGIRELSVEVSDTSASDGFREIFAGTLEKGVDGQHFPIANPLPGRWLRANFKSNHGGEWFSLTEIRAFGEASPPRLAENVEGVYQSVWGAFNVTRNGTAISGCYQPDGQSTASATFTGGLEGNIARVIYTETDESGAPGKPLPTLLVFARDGARMLFIRVNDYGNGLDEFKDVPRSAAHAGHCAGRSEDKTGTLADDIEKNGRATVYGINFDFNSANLRAESETVLQQVAELLRTQPSLSIAIEGHTDDVGSDAYNLNLSEQRAEAVKNWLVRNGIDAARLQAEGKGAGSPIASNATDIGRAQNRRVELVKR